MFKRHIVATAIVLIAIATAAVTQLLRHSDVEQRALEAMIGGDEEATVKALHQRRFGVRRDILHGSGKQLRSVIFSETADLCLDYQDKDAIEQLVRPYGYSQELLVPAAREASAYQIIRYFEAEEGAYHHRKHAITLSSPSVMRYQRDGHSLPDVFDGFSPSMTGKACSAEIQLTPRFSVVAEEPYGEFAAQQVNVCARHLTYEAGTLGLSGDVCMHSPKAAAYAETITLSCVSGTGSDAVEHATLAGGVIIHLPDGSQLLGDHVEIDFLQGLAYLRASTNSFVQWRQPNLTPNGLLLCRMLTVFFDAKGMREAHQPQVTELIAEGDVAVSQEGVWTAKGDVMIFKQTKESSDRLMTLTSLRQDHPCVVEGNNGARLETVRLTYDLDKGILHLAGAEAEQGTQQLLARGAVTIDHKAGCATFLSPIGHDGQVVRADQVVFSDGVAEMHADQVVIEYVLDGSRFLPAHLLADGNVCLKGSFGDSPVTNAGQYAICDKLEYWPDRQRLLLSSGEGRVAMLDKSSGIAVSAPAVEMWKSLDTGKNAIKGIGNVRFSLLDRDYQKLRERFGLDLLEAR